MKKRLLLLAMCLVLSMGLMAGCGDDSSSSSSTSGDSTVSSSTDSSSDIPEGTVVKVGFIAPITGSNAAEGTAAANAFQMVFDELNAAGTLGYEVEVVVMDDASTAESAASAAQYLTADSDVIAISGHWNSGCAEATIPICIKAEIPLMIWGAIGDTLTSEANYPYVTRVAPTSAQENEPTVANVYELGYRNFYIVSDTTSYGTQNTATFTAEIANYSDATILGTDEVVIGTIDFSAIVAKIAASGADAVYFGGVSTEAGLLKKQMVAAGLDDVVLFGISGIASSDFVTAAGVDAAEGTISNMPGVDPTTTTLGQEFIAAYAAAGFSEPIGAFTPYAYDSAVMLIAALESIDGVPTAELMIDAIANAEGEGLLGTTTFDEIGQTTNPASYMVVCENGEWVAYSESSYAN